MGRTGRSLGVVTAAVVLAGIVALHAGIRSPGPRGAPVAVVGAPVVIARAAAPLPPAALPAPSAEPQRPQRRLVDTIATHDRRGGDVRMMAGTMTTQARPAAATAVEATMTAAVARLPLFAASADPVHVSCVRTACEVAGLLPPGQTQASMTAVFRDKGLERDLLSRGYTPGPVLVADTGDGHSGFVFYINNEF